jgi:hypothetical protein
VRDRLNLVFLIALLPIAPVALFAHHGTAVYDTSKLVTVKGTVTGWSWTNPHCLLEFDVKDDYRFVVQTSGTDERTWLDNAGRPHTDELRVEEQFHRVDHDTLELTVTIDDPKIYMKPWVALDKLRFKLQPPNTDAREMICSPSETAEYNKKLAFPAAGAGK